MANVTFWYGGFIDTDLTLDLQTLSSKFPFELNLVL